MHIIAFGTDEHMLDTHSRQHARLLTYVPMVESFTVVVFSKKVDFEVAQLGTLTLIQLPKKNLFTNLRKLYKHLKEHKKDNTIISSQDPFEVGLISYIFSILLRLPFHVQIHTAIQSKIAQTESVRARLQYWTCLFLLPRVKSFRVVSGAIKRFLIQKGIDEKKIFVSPVIEDISGELKTKTYTGGRIEILCVARFVFFKNLPALVEAFAEFSEHHDAHLTIVGGGPLRKELEDKIKMLGLQEKVTLLDWVADVSELYKNADLYIHPSYYEGFGMAIVEAVGYGVPVLVTPDVGAVDYVTKENGYVMSGYRVPHLIQSLEYAVKNLIHLQPQNVKNSLHIISKTDNDRIQKESYAYALHK